MNLFLNLKTATFCKILAIIVVFFLCIHVPIYHNQQCLIGKTRLSQHNKRKSVFEEEKVSVVLINFINKVIIILPSKFFIYDFDVITVLTYC